MLPLVLAVCAPLLAQSETTPPDGVVRPDEVVPTSADPAEVPPVDPAVVPGAAPLVEAPKASKVEGPSACRPDAVFPDTDWATGEVAHPEALAALEAYLFDPELDWSDEDRPGRRTDGLVIVHGGRLVYERYANGYTAEMPHLAWSMAKTVTALLAGIGVRDGALSPEDSICDHIPGLPAASCGVSLDDLMQFGSGFDWLETYEGSSPTESSVLQMLYGDGRTDMGRFVANHPLRAQPGSLYMYSSGDTNVLAAALDSALREDHGDGWPHALFFDVIGASESVLERDGSDVIVGSSYWWATPRDMARVGLFLREDGCWKGTPHLPEGWVAGMSEVNEPIRRTAYGRSGWDVQGRQLWLNQAVAERGMETRGWPHVPDDAVAALGYWRQSIVVIPSADLVVVRTADDRDRSLDYDRYLSLVLATVGEGPLLDDSAFAPIEWGPQQRAPVPQVKRYDTGLFSLGSGFAAKQACSCTFVLGRDADFCRDWLRVSPDVARFRIDVEDKVVTARALGMGKQVARYVDDERGCRLD